MKNVTDKNFGLVIAFLLPGFICLWGLSFSYTEIAALLAKSSVDESPSVGGFLYASLASLALGLLLSAVRWLILDHVLLWTGIQQSPLDFSQLKDSGKSMAFNAIIEHHYRYYQYYSNTLVGIFIAFLVYLVRGPAYPPLSVWVLVMAVLIALFFGSRDALGKYEDRAESILGTGASE